MSVLKRNIVANFGGQAALTVIAFITVPLYVRYLGPEGFGLVSFLLSLQALTALIDFGLSTTASREISRYVAQQRDAGDRRNLIRTLEAFYYSSGVLIFLACAAAAPWLATSWLRSAEFDAATLRTCVLIAAAAIALRWPNALYQGILRGTEWQVVLNLTNSVTALIRGVGTILVLVFLTRSVIAFFWWQLAFSFLELAVYIAVNQRYTAGFSGRSGTFRVSILRDLWRFSVKVGGLSVFALILKQVDKLLISTLLPISQLGFYTAASMASNGITKVAQPVQTAVFPRLTQLHEARNWSALSDTFHRCCQITAFISVPFAALLLFFPDDVLWLWTRNRELTAQASPVLAVLAASMMLNCMMSVPFSLQLAAGLTMLPLMTNGIALVLMAPLIFGLVKVYGLVGAAYAWLAGNALYYLVVPPLMFRRVLNGQYHRWLLRDTLPFLGGGIVCFGVARWVAGDHNLAAKITAATAAFVAYGGLMLSVDRSLRHAIFGALPRRSAGLRALLAPSRD